MKTKTIKTKAKKSPDVVDIVISLPTDKERNEFVMELQAKGREEEYRKFCNLMAKREISAFSNLSDIGMYVEDSITNGIAVIEKVVVDDKNNLFALININNEKRLMAISLNVVSFYNENPIFAVESINEPFNKKSLFNIVGSTFFRAKVFYGKKVKPFDEKDLKGKVFIYDAILKKYVVRDYVKFNNDNFIVVDDISKVWMSVFSLKEMKGNFVVA